jgi:hypothetical protein
VHTGLKYGYLSSIFDEDFARYRNSFLRTGYAPNSIKMLIKAKTSRSDFNGLYDR